MPGTRSTPGQASSGWRPNLHRRRTEPLVRTADLDTLPERQRLHPVDLTEAEPAALNRSGLAKAEPDIAGWRVTAEYAVGAVRRGDLLVRVTPKIGVVQV